MVPATRTRRRARIAAGAALLLTLALVAPAWPATGTVELVVTVRPEKSSSAAPRTTSVQVSNPGDNECYTVESLVSLHPGDESVSFQRVTNSTNERLILFRGDHCGGGRVGDMVGPGQQRTVEFKSFQVYYTGAGNILP